MWLVINKYNLQIDTVAETAKSGFKCLKMHIPRKGTKFAYKVKYDKKMAQNGRLLQNIRNFQLW